MGIFNSLKRIKSNQQTAIEDFEQEPKEEEKIESIKTLNLGWYFSDAKEEFQMAKISEKDRATHFYVVGASGSGKSKFLEFLIRQDIDKANGFGIIDPHGDLIEDIKCYLSLVLPKQEIEQKIVLIDPTDPKYTVAFNPLEQIQDISSAEISAEMVEAFKKIWGAESSSQAYGWGARMEDLLRNSFIALIEAGLTLSDLPLLLTDKAFREKVLSKTKHPIAIQYFQRYTSLQERTRNEWIESTMNKVHAFLSDDRIREMLSFKNSSFSLREIMDSKKILLLKLDRGKLKDDADLIGSLFMTKIKMAAFSRTDLPKEKRIPFYLYVDEFQNFATESFIETLAEARKYSLALIMAHQNLSQLPRDLQDSILTNSGIQVYFRTSRRDAERLAKEAFETTGMEIKRVKLSPEAFDYDWFSYQEEWERYFQELQNLAPRIYYVKHKIQGGIIPIQTAEVKTPFEEFGFDKDEHMALLEKCQFGKKYLLKRGEEGKREEPFKREIKEEESISKEEKKKPKQKYQPRTLEEIIASIEPIEEAMIYAIGIGNYLSGEIYQAANERLKEKGFSTQGYSQYKDKFSELSKKPQEGKGLIEFTKRGRSFCYWLSQWGEIAFAEKFGKPPDRVINELGGGGLLPRSISLELIKNWLEPEGYKVKKEQEIETERTQSGKAHTDLVAEKDGEVLRIEIEHRSSKEQIEKNIRKNLEYSDVVYEVASDEAAKKKVIQVALRTMFRLRKEGPDKDLRVKIACVDELKRSQFKDWFEVGNR